MRIPKKEEVCSALQNLSVSLFLGVAAIFFQPKFSSAIELQESVPTSRRADLFMAQVRPMVTRELADKRMQLGAPIFMRIFKIPSELEVWIQKGEKFELFKKYPICSYSGYAGPKLREGDWQSPEGFYTVSGSQLNPESSFHLSFDIGYPNAFDRAHARTGGFIMVHGNCLSQGCFAMGDRQIEEIYFLAYHAFLQGQERFSIHIFPFRMTRINLDKYRDSPWNDFWENLRAGFNVFERTQQVPTVITIGKKYVVQQRNQLRQISMTAR